MRSTMTSTILLNLPNQTLHKKISLRMKRIVIVSDGEAQSEGGSPLHQSLIRKIRMLQSSKKTLMAIFLENKMNSKISFPLPTPAYLLHQLNHSTNHPAPSQPPALYSLQCRHPFRHARLRPYKLQVLSSRHVSCLQMTKNRCNDRLSRSQMHSLLNAEARNFLLEASQPKS